MAPVFSKMKQKKNEKLYVLLKQPDVSVGSTWWIHASHSLRSQPFCVALQILGLNVELCWFK